MKTFTGNGKKRKKKSDLNFQNGVKRIMKLQIADFIVDIRNESTKPEQLYGGYIYSGDHDPDVMAYFSDEEWEAEQAAMGIHRRPKVAADFCSFRKFAEALPLHNAILLHSACFDVEGVGVAFAAHSGTGKTTHMTLWQQLLGDRMTVVNGDKPIVRFFDEPDGSSVGDDAHIVPQDPSVFAYGTPWNGKEQLGCNMRTPLRHICFIERAEQNSCEPMTDTSEAINRIFNQVYMPKDPVALAKTMELINRLIDSVSLWKIKCNMDPSAAAVAYNTIFGK